MCDDGIQDSPVLCSQVSSSTVANKLSIVGFSNCLFDLMFVTSCGLIHSFLGSRKNQEQFSLVQDHLGDEGNFPLSSVL